MEQGEQLNMHILHKNRNVQHVTEQWMRSGFVEEYFNVEKKHLAITQMVTDKVKRETPLVSDVEIEMDSRTFLEYENEPLMGDEIWLKMNKEKVFEKATAYLLKSDEAEAEREFLRNRNVDEEEIRRKGLGSSRYIQDSEWQDVLGMSVHPALKNIMKVDVVHGVLIPFKYKGDVMGSSVRAVPVTDMKYATSHPDMLIGNWDTLRESNEDMVIVEGLFDEFAMERVGYENVGFIHTASPTIPQMAGIVNEAKRKGKKVTLALDTDKVGSYGMYVWSFVAEYAGVEMDFLLVEGVKDPAEAVHVEGWTKNDFENHRVSDREELKKLFQKSKEKKRVNYEGYLKERGKVSVDFRKDKEG